MATRKLKIVRWVIAADATPGRSGGYMQSITGPTVTCAAPKTSQIRRYRQWWSAILAHVFNFLMRRLLPGAGAGHGQLNHHSLRR
jgi:hypothetical protein